MHGATKVGRGVQGRSELGAELCNTGDEGRDEGGQHSSDKGEGGSSGDHDNGAHTQERIQVRL